RDRRQRSLGFQEKETSRFISKLEEESADAKSVIDVLEKRRTENEERINALRQEKAALEGEIIKGEKSLHLASDELDVSKEEKKLLADKLKEVNAGIDVVQKEISGQNKELAHIKSKKLKLKAEISELRDPSVLAKLNAFGEKKGEISRLLAGVESDIKNMTVQLTDLLEPEKERIHQITRQLEKEEKEFKAQIEALGTAVERDTKDLKEKEKKQKDFYSKFKELFAKREAITKEIQKLEGDIIRKEEQARTAEFQGNSLSLKKAEIVGKRSGLEHEFEQYASVPLLEGKTEEELKREIARFERLVVEMGNVNMKALEVYDAIEKEYNSLLDKKEKLKKEKQDVLLMINEVDAKKKELFMNTYNVINDQFKRIFLSLSNKGEASLVLENEEDPFAEGVRIRVRLSGKKYLDIRGLSGGEKTLTALAFIFAIQEHEPASFYILDEVDAALDKHNSEKLARLIREYCSKAQYIIISHNDALISEADNLYGISMNEHGMSKVTTLQI
ncbi:hypothetical protein COY95_03675, partial [Candidatus Woesearchaeota archaeon CG_4_10_14_0_8_um_filter_47_5]